MSLKQKTRELLKRREEVQLGGGEEAIEKQKAIGKLTARERILALLDKDSFQINPDRFLLPEKEVN